MLIPFYAYLFLYNICKRKRGGNQMRNRNFLNVNESLSAVGKYERSRVLYHFYLAGFIYYDGLEAMEYIAPGQLVDLVAEINNPHDPNAIAVYLKGFKIGYVPKQNNEFLHQLLYFGHEDMLETRIQFIDHLAKTPARQIQITVKIRDNREDEKDL